MIDTEGAIAEAIAEAQELAADSFWKAAYAGALPAVTLLVRNLDHRGFDYFLIEFRKDSRSTGRMIVDRRTGIVDVATGIEADGEQLPTFIAPANARSAVTPDVVLKDGRIVHPPSGTPTIVALWQHCQESHTMLQPFYWLRWPTAGLFLRIDGVFFDRLTPTDGLPVRHA